MPKNAPVSLSPKAFADLKKITIEEYGPDQTDQEIEEMGLRLLRFFNLVLPKQQERSDLRLSDEEAYAVLYINRRLKEGTQPTVRGVAEAIGRRSSRSGQRMMDSLIAKGCIRRDSEGKIQLRLTVTAKGIFLPA